MASVGRYDQMPEHMKLYHQRFYCPPLLNRRLWVTGESISGLARMQSKPNHRTRRGKYRLLQEKVTAFIGRPLWKRLRGWWPKVVQVKLYQMLKNVSRRQTEIGGAT